MDVWGTLHPAVKSALRHQNIMKTFSDVFPVLWRSGSCCQMKCERFKSSGELTPFVVGLLSEGAERPPGFPRMCFLIC